MKQPKILLLDIETAPILASIWGIHDQEIPLNMIKSDCHLLSFAAKWVGTKKIIYMDQSKEKNIEDDSKLLKELWKLLDEADVVVGHNVKSFDTKKIQARFLLNDMQPPSSFKQIDTLNIARRHFGFTSNKLEFLSSKLNKKYKKLKHTKFPGFELWKECLAGNKAAWKEMRKYNSYDVLALEELYHKLLPWDNSVNFNLYSDEEETVCSCGSKKYRKNGYFYSSVGRFQRYRCSDCGKELRDRTSVLSKNKKKSLKIQTTR